MPIPTAYNIASARLHVQNVEKILEFSFHQSEEKQLEKTYI
jgi:hypothetical protein